MSFVIKFVRSIAMLPLTPMARSMPIISIPAARTLHLVGKTSEVIGAPQIDQIASLPDRTFSGQGYESHVQMFFSEASGWSCRKVSRVSSHIPIVRFDRGNRVGETRMMPAWSSPEARNC